MDNETTTNGDTPLQLNVSGIDEWEALKRFRHTLALKVKSRVDSFLKRVDDLEKRIQILKEMATTPSVIPQVEVVKTTNTSGKRESWTWEGLP